MTKAKSAYSTRDSVEEAVNDIAGQLQGFETKALIFFASPHFDESVSRQMQDAFEDATVFGCTTAGEITSGQMLRRSVVALALGKEVVSDLQVAVVENLRDRVDVRPAFRQFEEHFKAPLSHMDLRKYAGIVLIDGLSGAEERVMDQIGDLTDITFVGGSAGDDLRFEATRVYAGGKAYTDAALLALMHLDAGFDIIKTQSFKVLDKRLVVTKANEAAREVAEIDGKPAALAYAEAVGRPVAEVPDYFMHNPVGIMLHDEPYVRSPQRLENNSIIFYCNIPEGMEVSLLESTHIIKDTQEVLQARCDEAGPITGIINFHCVLRTMELEKTGQAEAYGKLFAGVPTAGFSTYGEEYIGHLNQTSTMLVLL
ncbi:FIST signal transduction protein [Methanocella sp. MCL-LM]|uniref:FIST signal transduction protein n=1 Tax=Methanocella sp. MCL-LM TaxID=3412035 RepID=UPI003C78D9DD